MTLIKSLDFLKQLKCNNNRDWMQAHKDLYQNAKGEFTGFVSQLLTKLVLIDQGLNGLEAKKCIFRVNRDIRFSKDKKPYKENFGAFMVEGGKQSGNAGYYLHLEPGNNSFIAGGVHTPTTEKLSQIRQEIDYNPAELKNIVERPAFLQSFGILQGDKLKRMPKGYEISHPNAELLKLKSFLAIKNVTDSDVLNDAFFENALKTFSEIVPLNEYLNVAMS